MLVKDARNGGLLAKAYIRLDSDDRSCHSLE